MSTRDPKNSLTEWTDDIPSGWKVDRLGNVAEILFSNVDKHTVEEEERVRLCNYVDVYNNGRITETIDFMEASALPREVEKFQLRRGDVLATKDSETPDDIAISSLVADELPGVLCGYHLALMRPRKHKLFGPYLAWLHASKAFRAQYEAEAVGVTRWGLAQAAFKKALVPLPPVSEQERIAAYLDESCAALDAAVAAKRDQLETLDALRKATITSAVTRGLASAVNFKSTGSSWLGEIPQGWKLVCLKRVAKIQGGLTLGKVYDGPLVERPYLRVANVQDGHLALDEVTTIEVPASIARGVELRPGDVLMTEGGDLDKLGRGTLWTGEIEACLHQNHIFAVRCMPHKLRPQFLAYLTTSQYGRDYFEATGKKTTNLAATNTTKVGLFPLPLPLIPEQDAIIAHLDIKLAEVKQIVSCIERQIETLIAYRKSLIHECVTGQRRVTDSGLIRVQTHG